MPHADDVRTAFEQARGRATRDAVLTVLANLPLDTSLGELLDTVRDSKLAPALLALTLSDIAEVEARRAGPNSSAAGGVERDDILEGAIEAYLEVQATGIHAEHLRP